MKRRVLVVASEQFEIAPIRRAVAGRSDVEFVFTSNGPGPTLAGDAVTKAGGLDSFDAVVSTGLCGALVDDLWVGAIVVADKVNGKPASEPQTKRGYRSGAVASVDYVASSWTVKQQLQKSGAVAVEMEAEAVRERAEAAEKPFYCVKAVSDLAREEFVLDLNSARGKDGRFRVSNIIGQACLSPAAGFPELIRLKRNSGVALHALGEFFADCNF